MTTIASALQAVRGRISAAVSLTSRPHHVALLAVSKGISAEKVREAYAAGQRHFAESYVQEAVQKMTLLAELEIDWHFIGPVQSNKTSEIARNFAWVHSVDRIKIAERLNAGRAEQLPPLNICLQVNISKETSKQGIDESFLPELAHATHALPRLKLRGLMTIPRATTDVALQRAQFKRLRDLKELLNTQGFHLDTLSMGMSADFPAAIAEGATMVRVGTAIFGARQ